MIARLLALVVVVLALGSVAEAAQKKTTKAASRPQASVPLPKSKPIPLEIGKTKLPDELGGARRKIRVASLGIRGVGARNAESGLDGSLRAEIARLRSRHGASAVRVIAGAAHRMVAGTNMVSCHSGGHAFDGYLSAPALSDLRTTSFGIITYSGRFNHVHVSSCARERGLRAHTNGSSVGAKRWAKKRAKRRR